MLVVAGPAQGGGAVDRRPDPARRPLLGRQPAPVAVEERRAEIGTSRSQLEHDPHQVPAHRFLDLAALEVDDTDGEAAAVLAVDEPVPRAEVAVADGGGGVRGLDKGGLGQDLDVLGGEPGLAGSVERPFALAAPRRPLADHAPDGRAGVDACGEQAGLPVHLALLGRAERGLHGRGARKRRGDDEPRAGVLAQQDRGPARAEGRHEAAVGSGLAPLHELVLELLGEQTATVTGTDLPHRRQIRPVPRVRAQHHVRAGRLVEQSVGRVGERRPAHAAQPRVESGLPRAISARACAV